MFVTETAEYERQGLTGWQTVPFKDNQVRTPPSPPVFVLLLLRLQLLRVPIPRLSPPVHPPAWRTPRFPSDFASIVSNVPFSTCGTRNPVALLPQDVLDLLTKRPTGIFPLLDQQALLGERASDEAFVLSVKRAHAANASFKVLP